MNKRQSGMSLAEVLVALAILSTVVVFSGNLLTSAYLRTRDNTNRQFAVQKAMSMLEELKALIQNEATSAVLDAYDDGTVNQPVLTTEAGITDPAARASGNRRIPGGWLFERHITVQKVPGTNDLRLVNVKVFLNGAGGTRLLAEVASVLSTSGQNAPPTQVYDIYLVAIENVPGWWVYMQNVVPFVESAMQDLESRHRGLQFRRHWIRKLSYGRDPYYTPDVNAKTDSTQPIRTVYFYPGLLPAGSPVTCYYPPDFFNGRVRIDGEVKNGFGTTNLFPYSLADQYNTGMRHEEEKALFDLRVAAGLESRDAPTLRLLLDDMYANPSQYTNAILINLHGELLPFPPLRNYSDPAKDPAKYPAVRVVTHPERLRVTNNDAVNLRIYAYHTNTSNASAVPDWMGKGSTATPISVVLKNITWTPGSAYVTAISGGVDFDGNGTLDSYAAGPAGTTPLQTAAPTQMWWTSQTVGSDTVIRLYNTPLKAPCVKVKKDCDGGGLDDALRLYDLQYIPSPVENLPDSTSPLPFTTNLTNKQLVTKNTARWVITIPSSVLPQNSVLTFETRIGEDFKDGISSPPSEAKSNLSRTYAYRGDDVWAFGDATHPPNVPLTERFQFIGDPRHCPYADSKMPHGSSGLARADALGMGYNRYFDDFDTSGADRDADWPGWSYQAPALTGSWYGIKNNSADSANNNDGWETGGGSLEVDVPRMFQVLRSALLRTHAVYTTMTGFSYYYLGLGNEIGYDSANGFPDSIQLSEQPFNGGSGKRYEQSITNDVIKGATGGVKLIAENATGWWGMSWLGELYPDSAYATWKTTGNLPSGSASGTFVRVLRENVTAHLPAGTSFVAAVRRTGPPGSTTFFWSGTANATFHHAPADNTEGSLDADGLVISQSYKLPLPASISNNRPFDVNLKDTGANPNHFLQPVYGNATTLGTEARFYKHQNNIQGSSLLSMRSSTDTAFVVVNGLSPVGESGVAFIARWSFLSLVQSFLSAGLTKVSGAADPARVRELPRVVIAEPNDSMELADPTSLTIKWSVAWQRWDGLPYTPAYPTGFSEDTAVRYALLYSRDNGKSWRYMKDETVPCTPGRRPADELMESGTSYDWDVPSSSFPKGNYLIRVEAYRDAVPLHYAFHQYRAFIKRS